MSICNALRDLVPFVQSKTSENTHRGVILLVKLLAEVCDLTKSNTPPWVFTFLNFTNGTNLRDPSHLVIEIGVGTRLMPM